MKNNTPSTIIADQISHELYFANRHLYEEPKRSDQLVYRFEPMNPIGPKENPFHYDSTSMGVNIAGGVTVMLHTPSKDKALTNAYLHSSDTGQRVRIAVMAADPVPKKILYLSGPEKTNTESDMFHNMRVSTAADGLLYTYESIKASAHISEFDTTPQAKPWQAELDRRNDFVGVKNPVWYVYDGIGILVENGKAAISPEEYQIYYAGDFVDDAKFSKAYSALQSALGAV